MRRKLTIAVLVRAVLPVTNNLNKYFDKNASGAFPREGRMVARPGPFRQRARAVPSRARWRLRALRSRPLRVGPPVALAAPCGASMTDRSAPAPTRADPARLPEGDPWDRLRAI